MYKIKKIAYDVYKLNYDLGSGDIIKSENVKIPKGMTFKSIGGLLKYAAEKIGTAYHRCDWCFEEDLDDKGTGGWVLHIIVDKNMKYANRKTIEKFRKNDNSILVDLLVNVFIDNEINN